MALTLTVIAGLVLGVIEGMNAAGEGTQGPGGAEGEEGRSRREARGLGLVHVAPREAHQLSRRGDHPPAQSRQRLAESRRGTLAPTPGKAAQRDLIRAWVDGWVGGWVGGWAGGWVGEWVGG